jgi:hypothetical protein
MINKPNKEQKAFAKNFLPNNAVLTGWQSVDEETIRFWYEEDGKLKCQIAPVKLNKK